MFTQVLFISFPFPQTISDCHVIVLVKAGGRRVKKYWFLILVFFFPYWFVMILAELYWGLGF